MNEMQTVHFSASEGNHEVSPHHDARLYTPENAEASLADRNVHVQTTIDLKTAVNERMRNTIEEYNARQKRADRKMDHDVYSKLRNGGKNTQPVIEFVVGIGDHESCGITDDEFDGEFWAQLKKDGKLEDAAAYVEMHLNRDPRLEDAKQVLLNFAERFKERFPNFEILNIHIHADEPNSGLHMHMEVMPISMKKEQGGYKRGTKEQISYSGACEDAGFFTATERRRDPRTGKMKNMRISEIQKFEEAGRDYLAQDMEELGFKRAYKGGGRKRKNIHVFKETREAEERAAVAKEQEEQALAGVQAAKEAIDDYTKMIEETNAALNEREVKVAEKEAAVKTLEKRLEELESRESSLKEQEDEIETKIERAQHKVKEAEDKAKEILDEAETHADTILSKKKTALAKREEAVEKKEDRIQEDADRLAEERASFDAEKESLETNRAILAAKQEELDKQENEMNALASKLRNALAATEVLHRRFAEKMDKVSLGITKSVNKVIEAMARRKVTLNGEERSMLDITEDILISEDAREGTTDYSDSLRTLVAVKDEEKLRERYERAQRIIDDYESVQKSSEDDQQYDGK